MGHIKQVGRISVLSVHLHVRLYNVDEPEYKHYFSFDKHKQNCLKFQKHSSFTQL